MQLIDTMSVRFGIMIIGQTLTGKSTIIRSLKEVHNQMKEREEKEEYIGVEMQILNPKSIAMSELYGNFSHITHEWTDGLASSIIR
jgi:dynein heavy chain, axonemal